MAAIAAALAGLGAVLDDATATSEQDIAQHIADVAQRLAERRLAHEAARAELARSADRQASEPADTIAEWMRARDTCKLHRRADRLERTAAAAMVIAATAMEEAAQACLVALLARKQAIAIQIRQADEPP